MSQPDFVYLMGHRGTGKTTTGQMAAHALDWEFVDLDEMIEAITGQSCAEIIADGEERFRRIERRTLDALRTRRRASGNTPCIIALGGGFHPLPDDGLRVWLYREGWRETARHEREPLHQDSAENLDEELDAMVAQREPRWEASSHLRLHIPRGRPVERAADELTTLIRWSRELPDDIYCPRTWLTPTSPGELERARRDCSIFGFSGIEFRSDLFDAEAAADIEESTILASVRTDDPGWLEEVFTRGQVDAVDIDIDHLPALLKSDVLKDSGASRVIVSTHPEAPTDDAFEALLAAGEELTTSDIVSRDDVVLKYAPEIRNVAEIEAMLRHRDRALAEDWQVTVLPQGEDYTWLRPMLARTNATNYMPVGFEPSRRHVTDGGPHPRFDLQRWLPHLAGPTPESFDGLIGFPVELSQGDVWHRRAALSGESDDRSRSYLKIPVDPSEEGHDLGAYLRLLHRLDMRGLSVTSPLKRSILEVPVVDSNDLEAANTLTRLASGEDEPTWRADDTDAEGMRRCLRSLEEDHDIGPGDVAVIGTGGVAPALRRAIEASEWTLVAHVAGRDGWSGVSAGPVDLIVNAAGDHDTPYEDPPPSTAWLDLHYRQVRPPPEDTKVHLNGDLFFDGQAAAQRRIWSH